MVRLSRNAILLATAHLGDDLMQFMPMHPSAVTQDRLLETSPDRLRGTWQDFGFGRLIDFEPAVQVA